MVAMVQSLTAFSVERGKLGKFARLMQCWNGRCGGLSSPPILCSDKMISKKSCLSRERTW